MPVRVRDRLGVDLGLLGQAVALRPGDVDDAVDDRVRDVHALGAELPREGLRQGAQGELHGGEGGEERGAFDGGGGAGEDEGGRVRGGGGGGEEEGEGGLGEEEGAFAVGWMLAVDFAVEIVPMGIFGRRLHSGVHDGCRRERMDPLTRCPHNSHPTPPPSAPETAS